jgi:hypothetical protein
MHAIRLSLCTHLVTILHVFETNSVSSSRNLFRRVDSKAFETHESWWLYVTESFWFHALVCRQTFGMSS